MSTFGYVDVNPDPVGNAKGDLLFEKDAVIYGSLRNLFACPVGDRGRIFRPTYGTTLYNFLGEPLDGLTANKLHMVIVQAAQSEEPRIEVLTGLTRVIPVPELPGYRILFGFKIVGENSIHQASFLLPV